MFTIALALLALQTPQADTARFQQGVDYRIEARLDEDAQVLRGRARLRYVNNSPATLDTIWLHQHLNAFRPNSAWARRELELGNRRFQDLGPEEHAFERLTSLEVDGAAVSPVYPLAPDSTVVGVPLPAPLRPGQTAVLRMDWDARPSTLPRRQGRSGRHYDFAQWYPRVAVYDRGGWQVQPLLPQGEFYGEFASYDVTLDVRDDQVIGATGVPAEGDPGWEAAAAAAGAIDYQRDAYPAPAAEALGLLEGGDEAGRKRVRWRAEDVHHFAWSVDPEFIYEQTETPRTDGAGEPIQIRILYLPGDTSWANGRAAGLTRGALDWLQEMFGPYPWPQLTNLHRIESGGTEFPMMMMNGSASEGLIVHEAAHQYLHGILANNEWRDGWLDEGFTSFITNWYFEDQGQTNVWAGSMRSIQERERRGLTYPIARPGEEFPDPQTYSAMTYTKTALVFRMLREMVGEETMREMMREYYRRHALHHVDEQDLRRVAEDVSGMELDWFFDQWLHTTRTLDYGVGDVRTEPLPGGRWRTTAEVLRLGGAWMPVEVEVDGERRTLESRDRVQTVQVVTRSRPAAVEVDPDDVLLDIDPENDRVGVGGQGSEVR